MRKLDRLCRKLARSIGRFFVVTKFSTGYIVHEYEPDTHASWSLGSFHRVVDVERFLLDKFN